MAERPQEEWRIERLTSAHDRSSFCCGKPSLDEFLRQFATQYDKRDLGRTYVAVRAGEAHVHGFYTIATGAVAFEAIPEGVRRKLPRHPIPVAHLGRLAVDQRAQGQGVGELLLLDALHRCCLLSEEVAIHAVEVYALDEQARSFYLKYGFEPLSDDPFHLYLQMKVIRKLWQTSTVRTRRSAAGI